MKFRGIFEITSVKLEQYSRMTMLRRVGNTMMIEDPGCSHLLTDQMLHFEQLIKQQKSAVGMKLIKSVKFQSVFSTI